MGQILERRPSPAMVVALIALFVALTGTTFAALRVDSGNIDNNTIVSKDLKNKKAVKSADVVDGSLTGADIFDGSLGTGDLADDVVNGSKVSNDSLTGGDIDESSLGAVPNATSATSATQLGGVDASEYSRRLWAVVLVAGGSPSIARSHGAIEVTDLGVGRTIVQFDRDITSCAWLATIGSISSASADPGEISTELQSAGVTDKLIVQTENSAGMDADMSFHLMVLC